MERHGDKPKPRIARNALNTLLRLGSLTAKLVFTLYIGRFLGLAELGTYGLITAWVAVLVTLLGMRFDYVVSRDIVDQSPLEITRRIKDQVVFYGLNYLVLAVVAAIALLGPLRGTHPKIILFTFILAVLESFIAIVGGNLVALKRPILASIVFFIRAALWTFPVIVLGILSPAFRTAGTILVFWMGGVIAALIVAFGSWWHLPWARALQTPVDWSWIGAGIRKCFFIWLGVIGATVATYIDRFVVQHNLGIEYVGIASFYGSFVIAIQSLLQSGVFAFSYPQLISYHKRHDKKQFRHEAWRMTRHAILFAGVSCVLIGIAVPVMGSTFKRPEFAANAMTLWLMLFGTWLRSTTEGLYYVLYARHQDHLVWIDGLFMLAPAVIGNLIMVPIFGLRGIGISSIVTACCLSAWRLYCVTHCRPAMHSAGMPPLAPSTVALPVRQKL